VSIKATSWVWAHSKAEGIALLVLLAIADHAHQDGRDAFPGLTKLSTMCRCSERTVRRAISHLEGLGELKVDRYKGAAPKGDKGGRRTNRYTITGLADAVMSSNSDEVNGHSHEVSGHFDEVSGHSYVQGTVRTDPSFDPAIDRTEEEPLYAGPSCDSLSERLYRGLKKNNSQVKMAECVDLVTRARRANIADFRIDQAIGEALTKDPCWPSYVEKWMQNRLHEMSRG
jgi:hypothetical protein